ncbi:proline-rich receptor-like protein kinase PERK4 isoform X2 [Vitis vinifera]|uniref:proline-rich receptor-like protein kinase PERK4 isoform X2 n=1 Tax=Vitis vinifera TaxID=29760 RepID=UPI00053F5F0C|nr:proline-rich receptor-like protein kinase PERK4 isoform X2 [Vitis vinifera]|eukprot:XP_010649161.1 PREDICTED: proline-rich receptor-like protein kinase PERK4 isoform X2 [Vitis vinifera]
MASSPETAPSSDSPPSPTPSSSSSPPSPDASPPPSEFDASPPSPNASPPPPAEQPPPSPAPSDDSTPPPSQSLSPPPPQNSPPSPPPPPSNNGSLPSPPPPSGSRRSPPPPNGVPPPPPPRSPSSSGALAPPPGSTSSSSDDSSSSDSLAVVVGAAVGAGLLLIALILICVTCAKRRKKRNQQASQATQYQSNPSGDNYYNSSQQSNWYNSPQSADHVVKLHQPPGGGWAPPPPPMISSGDMSSNYSGPRHPPLPPPSPNLALGFNKSTFTYEELAAATGGFAQANLLGQGGFGYVHKGVLPNGKEIAVKSLKSGSGQGEREFQAEVEIISRVHHRHLVSLVGYCIADGQRMLVYEFVHNKTLEHHLHVAGSGRPIMDWASRMRIALGSAKGLAYLHEDCHPKIIHRDIKTANILLDYNFEAMVADFGLAKLSTDNCTHVSTRVMGTFGYLAPEYASSGKLTEKSDVFSYGVMLLELITGRRPVDNAIFEESLVDWARPLLSRALADGNYDELVDRFLENNYNTQEMARMVACAAASIRHSAKRRPKMSQIVRALEGDVSLEDLNDVTKTNQSPAYSTSMSSEYNTRMYNADMEKFKKMALSSQEFGSSEDGTSEYGQNPSSSDNSQEMIHR